MKVPNDDAIFQDLMNSIDFGISEIQLGLDAWDSKNTSPCNPYGGKVEKETLQCNQPMWSR